MPAILVSVAVLGTSLISGCAASGQRSPFANAMWAKGKDATAGMSAQDREELAACRDAYDAGDYDKAVKLCRKAADDFAETSAGEEARYLLAESYYQQGRYPKAQDHYQRLFADYPSTRYVEPVTRRLYDIATRWLQISEPEQREKIRTVSAERVVESVEPEASTDPTLKYRILPNFHNQSRPVFDTQGQALRALKAIWMNDPTGPLADDALMLTADYYQRRRNYVESDRYYRILREEYPDSPHLEAAFTLGGHALQASYQGPMYDGQDLVSARRLKEQSLYLFPASTARSQMREDLGELEALEAERLWAMVDYYDRKDSPRAIAIACVKLISAFPESPRSDEARALLLSLDSKELERLPEVAEYYQILSASVKAAGEAGEQGTDLRSEDYGSTAGRVQL